MMTSMNKRESMKSYILASSLLPEKLWRAAFLINEDERVEAEEFRLRLGRPFSVVIRGQQRDIYYGGAAVMVTADDIESVISEATGHSYHSWEEQISQGFITVKGGHRLGLCGHIGAGERGKVLKDITSVNIRVSRQVLGVGETLAQRLMEGGLASTLIISPPGVGKTTLLRDLCRILSYHYRLSVADCRYEISGSIMGESQFDLGKSDIMCGGDKRQSINMLLRSMSPEIIALDEITANEDIAAIEEGSYTGCTFLATAHGDSLEKMARRPLYSRLLETGVFTKAVLLERVGGERLCRIFERSFENGQAGWRGDDNYILLGDRGVPQP